MIIYFCTRGNKNSYNNYCNTCVRSVVKSTHFVYLSEGDHSQELLR